MKRSRWFLMTGVVVLAAASVFASKARTTAYSNITTAVTGIPGDDQTSTYYLPPGIVHPICLPCGPYAYGGFFTAGGHVVGIHQLFTDIDGTHPLYF
jgi:hypothetical protein